MSIELDHASSTAALGTAHARWRRTFPLMLVLALATLGVTRASTEESLLVDALIAPGPHAALGGRMMLYGQFVGTWDVEVTNYPPDAPVTRARGEWTFGWALEGRAIQDVWAVPARANRDPTALAAGAYGTTLRFPEPEGPYWRVVWVHPWRNDVTVMRARMAGDEIVQNVVGEEADDATRWVFYDISANRFRWRAEERHGTGWRRLQEMVVTRKPEQHGAALRQLQEIALTRKSQSERP